MGPAGPDGRRDQAGMERRLAVIAQAEAERQRRLREREERDAERNVTRADVDRPADAGAETSPTPAAEAPATKAHAAAEAPARAGAAAGPLVAADSGERLDVGRHELLHRLGGKGDPRAVVERRAAGNVDPGVPRTVLVIDERAADHRADVGGVVADEQ